MIRTITLNTGFDETFLVSETSPGGVADVLERTVQPSGKGVNAARALVALGIPTRVYGLVGRAESRVFAHRLADQGIDSTLIEVDGETRRNLTLLSLREGLPAAHFRAPGFSLTGEGPIEAMLDRLRVECERADVVSLHGSTPVGLPVRTWARFARLARERGAHLVIDIYGQALPTALAEGGATLCKPNQEEMRVLPDAVSGSVEASARAALRWMDDHGVHLPLVSLGARGVMFHEDGNVFSAMVPVAKPKFLVGAGDACIAGLIAGLTRPGAARVSIAAEGVSTAAAHVEGCRGPALAQRARELKRLVTIQNLGRIN
jgi:1-phosphofructokinase